MARREPTERVQIPKVAYDKSLSRFDDELEIFSGEHYQKAGFCVRLNGDYIREGQQIKYFRTAKEARSFAYAIWKNE